MVKACSDRSFVRRSGLTNLYRILCSRSGSAWWFWFGGVGHYQSLPTRTYIPIGAFGLEAAPFTIAYQVSILGAGLPS